MSEQPAIWHLPTIPFGVIDAYNRRALAQGSPRIAQASAHSDINGHRVYVSFNEFRQYYTADYWWAGRNCIARGSLRQTVEAAARLYRKGALGSSVTVEVKPDEDLSVLHENGFISGPQPEHPSFLTWRHKLAGRCAPDAANPGRTTSIFDAELIMAAQSETEYFDYLKAKYGRTIRI